MAPPAFLSVISRRILHDVLIMRLQGYHMKRTMYTQTPPGDNLTKLKLVSLITSNRTIWAYFHQNQSSFENLTPVQGTVDLWHYFALYPISHRAAVTLTLLHLIILNADTFSCVKGLSFGHPINPLLPHCE